MQNHKSSSVSFFGKEAKVKDIKMKVKIRFILGVVFILQSFLVSSLIAESEDNDDTKAAKPTPPDYEVVSVEQGEIKGFKEHASKGETFYSFLSVPYAKPPIGERRFKAPEMVASWEGVRDGSVQPPACTQLNLEELIHTPKPSVVGQEDCLYLNIYTPMPNINFAELPVMVYIHGGQFVSGKAADYEPYDLMNHQMVVVVIQYRLGVLGFMSTEDSVMPGNFGLRDQTMALQWVQRNIEYFGGSPLNINIAGSGSGAASVHFQILSHHTIGLFKGAIMQSGSALCPWARGGVHKQAAYHLGKRFKCLPSDEETKEDTTTESEEVKNEEEKASENVETEEKLENRDSDSTDNTPSEEDNLDNEEVEIKEEPKEGENSEEVEKSEETIKNEELLKCLQNVDEKKLAGSAALFYMWSYLPVIFGPRVDNNFLPESPEFLLQQGRHKRVNMIIGINKDDGSLLTNSMFLSEGRRMALKHHFPLTGPISLEFSDDDLAPLNMSIKAYDKYLGHLNVDAPDAYNLTKLFTDRHFSVCSDISAELHSANNLKYKRNVFYYELHHRGQKSTTDEFKLDFGQEWVSQGDELFYLFPSSKSESRDEDDQKMTDLMTKMWFNFVSLGNPTPNNTMEFTWEPFTKEKPHHLKLTTTPEMEEDKREEVRQFWTTLPTSQNIYMYKDYFMKFLKASQTENSAEQGNQSREPSKDEL